MAEKLFQLPPEIILTPILQAFPCRDRQIRSLATLLYVWLQLLSLNDRELTALQPYAAPCRTLTIHGVEATGKTSITKSLLSSLSTHVPNLRHAVVNARQCITARHLFEAIVSSVAQAIEWPVEDTARRCETLSQLDIELCRMLKYPKREEGFRFVLVLGSVDRAREAPPTLLPGLARLSEIVSLRSANTCLQSSLG